MPHPLVPGLLLRLMGWARLRVTRWVKGLSVWFKIGQDWHGSFGGSWAVGEGPVGVLVVESVSIERSVWVLA